MRAAAHPRYHFEMALLRWMHLRKLVPLADVLEQFGSWQRPARVQAPARAPAREHRHVPAATRWRHQGRHRARRRRVERDAPAAAAPGPSGRSAAA